MTGKVLYIRQCASRHTLTAGELRDGPSLAGIMGKRVGEASGFEYSAALKSSNLKWNAALLDQWLTDSRATIPGTRMPYRLADPTITSLSPASRMEKNKASRLIHRMVRVFDEQRSLEFYKKGFGLKIEERFDSDSFSLIYLKNAEGDAELEETTNHDREKPYFHGDGYGYIAINVPDLDAEHARLCDAGIMTTEIKNFMINDALLVRFFFIVDPDGYKFDVLLRHGRYQ